MTKDGGTVKCCGEEVNMNLALRLLVSTACAALMALTGGIIYYNCVLPDNYYVAKGGELEISEHIAVRSDRIIPENYDIDITVSGNETYNVSSMNGGVSERTEQLSLFGIFPIKNVSVTEVNEPVVVPCGTPFGIKLLTKGVLVAEAADCCQGLQCAAGIAGVRHDDGLGIGAHKLRQSV